MVPLAALWLPILVSAVLELDRFNGLKYMIRTDDGFHGSRHSRIIH
jgi:hypothetical protein